MNCICPAPSVNTCPKTLNHSLHVCSCIVFFLLLWFVDGVNLANGNVFQAPFTPVVIKARDAQVRKLLPGHANFVPEVGQVARLFVRSWSPHVIWHDVAATKEKIFVSTNANVVCGPFRSCLRPLVPNPEARFAITCWPDPTNSGDEYLNFSEGLRREQICLQGATKGLSVPLAQKWPGRSGETDSPAV